MIKKVKIADLTTGMYIHDLDANWLSHRFLKNQFAIHNTATLAKIKKSGLQEVYIDTSKGQDVTQGVPTAVVHQNIGDKQHTLAKQAGPQLDPLSVAEEKNRARAVVREANNIIQTVLEHAGTGHPIDIESVRAVSSKLVDSVFRNKHALISLTRMKDKDHYTFQHSVSVCGLMVNFCRAMAFDKEITQQIAEGSMLHDVGKMLVPNEILCKPGRLTDPEFEIMRKHVVYSREILEKYPQIAQCGLDVAAQHHERIDGSGYPLGLKDDEISIYGKMSTIVDVYDALASVRCYKNAWEPSLVLKKLLEWSDHHFDPELVHKFIKSLGIYPVGSLVELTSGKLAVVIDQSSDDLLAPIVQIIYSIKQKSYLRPQRLDLSRNTTEKIKNWVDPDKFSIDITNFI